MSIFPEFKLTGVYLDIIELELYPARLPHFATLPLQSVCESVRESEWDRGREIKDCKDGVCEIHRSCM